MSSNYLSQRMIPVIESYRQDFMDVVSRSKTNDMGCTVWDGKKNAQGYGVYMAGFRMMAAHRLMFYYKNGNFSAKRVICHSCDNPSCVNPIHLIAGTVRFNNIDKARKGRSVAFKGERNGNSVLSERDVESIRESLRLKTMTQQELAIAYGVSQSNISLIKRNLLWTGR